MCRIGIYPVVQDMLRVEPSGSNLCQAFMAFYKNAHKGPMVADDPDSLVEVGKVPAIVTNHRTNLVLPCQFLEVVGLSGSKPRRFFEEKRDAILECGTGRMIYLIDRNQEQEAIRAGALNQLAEGLGHNRYCELRPQVLCFGHSSGRNTCHLYILEPCYGLQVIAGYSARSNNSKTNGDCHLSIGRSGDGDIEVQGIPS